MLDVIHALALCLQVQQHSVLQARGHAQYLALGVGHTKLPSIKQGHSHRDIIAVGVLWGKKVAVMEVVVVVAVKRV